MGAIVRIQNNPGCFSLLGLPKNVLSECVCRIVGPDLLSTIPHDMEYILGQLKANAGENGFLRCFHFLGVSLDFN